MTTRQNSETYALKQSLISTNATADVHNLLQSFPMTSSKNKAIFLMR
jgi:hypothetical protein